MRCEHPRWLVIWLVSIRRYRAYRLSQARRETTLTAATPDDLVAQIRQAEQAVRGAGAGPVTGGVTPGQGTGPSEAAT